MQNYHHHHVGTGADFASIFLVATSNLPMFLSAFPHAMQWLQVVGCVMGVLASGYVIVDHHLKIRWKLREARREREEERQKKEAEDEKGN
jgi:hypothetical protein